VEEQRGGQAGEAIEACGIAGISFVLSYGGHGKVLFKKRGSPLFTYDRQPMKKKVVIWVWICVSSMSLEKWYAPETD
jgi:hypothetical protein